MNIPPIPPPEETSETHQSLQEDRDWESEQKLKTRKTDNQIIFLKFFGCGLPIVLAVVVVLILATLSVWVWHYISSWVWLEEHQLDKIQSVFFSGGLGAIFAISMIRLFQKYLDN